MSAVALLTAEQIEDLLERAVSKALARGAGPEAISTADAARIAGRSPKTVRAWVSSGALPSSRRGRSIVIRREDLERFLAGVSPDGIVASLRG
jgi:excisionase family DNA binding protein